MASRSRPRRKNALPTAVPLQEPGFEEQVISLIVDGRLLQSLFHLEGFDPCGQHGDNPADYIVLKCEEVADPQNVASAPAACLAL